MSNTEFRPMAKTPRWYRDVMVTEKIDGTNASVWIRQRPDLYGNEHAPLSVEPGATYILGATSTGEATTFEVRAGSRTRFVVPGDDNFGFARWVWDNAAALVLLGEGTHFGEWWGTGIQRGYSHPRTFSLFNASRWAHVPEHDEEQLPDVPGLSVVPVLYRGPLAPRSGVDPVAESLRRLGYAGSLAAPGFMQPEGVIVYHVAGRVLFKATLDDDGHKGVRR